MKFDDFSDDIIGDDLCRTESRGFAASFEKKNGCKIEVVGYAS